MKKLNVLFSISLLASLQYAFADSVVHRNETGESASTEAAEEAIDSPYASSAVTLKKPKPKEEPKTETTEAKDTKTTTSTTTAKTTETVSPRKSILDDVKPVEVPKMKAEAVKGTGLEYAERDPAMESSAGKTGGKTAYTNTTALKMPCYSEVKKQDGTSDLIKVSGEGPKIFTGATQSQGTPKTPDEMITGGKNTLTAAEVKFPGMDVVYNTRPFTIPRGLDGETEDWYNTAADDAGNRASILAGTKELTEAGFVRQGGLLCFSSGGGGGGGGQGGGPGSLTRNGQNGQNGQGQGQGQGRQANAAPGNQGGRR